MRYCDLHCDLLHKLNDFNEWISNKEEYQVTPEDLFGGVLLQTFAVFAPNKNANMAYFEQKRLIFEQIKSYLRTRNVMAVLSVENAAFTEGKLENIRALSRAGVKSVGLVWNETNALGGAHGNREGLTAFGESAVEEILFCGMLPDVSHLSDAGFDVVERIAKRLHKPFVATHSVARTLCAHSRNLTDGQIRAVAKSGGVTGVHFYPPFLGARSPAEHIAYLIRKGGEESVAVGSDFDGMKNGYYSCVADAAMRLEDDLKKAGVTPRQTELVLQKNALRVFGTL